jgi:hypothetical protein
VLGHELVDDLVERLDAVFGGAAVKDLHAPGDPGREEAQSAFALVLVLDFLAPLAATAGTGAGFALARLDRGLLIGADDAVAGIGVALPGAGGEVEDRPSALREQWIAREDPGAVLPRLDRVLG